MRLYFIIFCIICLYFCATLVAFIDSADRQEIMANRVEKTCRDAVLTGTSIKLLDNVEEFMCECQSGLKRKQNGKLDDFLKEMTE